MNKSRRRPKVFKFSHPNERCSKWVRASLLRRSKGRCEICGDALSLTHNDPKQATVDHIVPRARGGGADLGNLQVACGYCNSRKEVIYGTR